jgi:hypothetical protein
LHCPQKFKNKKVMRRKLLTNFKETTEFETSGKEENKDEAPEVKEDRERKISARQSSRLKFLKFNQETNFKVIPSSIGAIFGKSTMCNPPNTRGFQFGSLSGLEPVQYSPSCTEYTALRKAGVGGWAASRPVF